MADVDSSLLLFARKIAPEARFVLSGECGDEVFGGYPWFRDAYSLNAEAFPPGPAPWNCARACSNGACAKSWTSAAMCAKRSPRPLPAWSTCPTRAPTAAVCAPIDIVYNLQERALTMCEHSHVEVLTPFADERLMQYVYNVPWEMKFMDGREKGLLREAAGALLPEALRYRKKSPYPKTCDPAYARIVCGMTQGMLAEKKSPILQLVDARALEKLAASDLSPTKTPWFGQLMAGPQMLAYLWQVNAWLADRHAEIAL